MKQEENLLLRVTPGVASTTKDTQSRGRRGETGYGLVTYSRKAASHFALQNLAINGELEGAANKDSKYEQKYAKTHKHH